MKLHLYNSLSRKLEEFLPLNPPKVTIYVCGITAYDSSHLGHARSAVIFDVLYRIVQYLGYEVIYVRNITDIDDKIINRSNREGLFWQDLTERYIREYQDEVGRLRVLPPTYEPRASEHIQEMISLIERLIQKGYAYVCEGDVYFSVEKFPSYGKLSGRRIEELLAGVRIEPSEKKRHPLDFALWKSAKPGEPFWESPWGPGRPGWHVECSAMSMRYLGATIDIHGGGLDLKFPHHENEIAQSEAATDQTFARYFIHHGLITVNGEKMSKSLGNFVTTSYLLEKFHPEVIRAFLLSEKYSSPLDYTEKSLRDSEKAVYHLYETLYLASKITTQRDGEKSKVWMSLAQDFSKFKDNFLQALLNDLNTALALGYLFAFESKLYDVLTKGWTNLTKKDLEGLKGLIKDLQGLVGNLLGLLQDDPEEFWRKERKRKLAPIGVDFSQVEELIQRRFRARRERNFALADKIRDELKNYRIVLRDLKDETFWFVE